jgi:hypothetical protein
MPPGAPAELKPAKKVPVRLILTIVLVAVVAIGGWFFSRDNVENAAVGDCAAYDQSDENSMYKVVECTEPTAEYKVLTISDSDEDSCKEVPGASRSWTSNSKTVCMGEKDIDPSRAVNAVKEGDCMVVTGQDALKADCASAEATDKVLKRLTDVSEIGADRACIDVEGTETYYTWQWTSDSKLGDLALTYDVLLCLGPK